MAYICTLFASDRSIQDAQGACNGRPEGTHFVLETTALFEERTANCRTPRGQDLPATGRTLEILIICIHTYHIPIEPI